MSERRCPSGPGSASRTSTGVSFEKERRESFSFLFLFSVSVLVLSLSIYLSIYLPFFPLTFFLPLSLSLALSLLPSQGDGGVAYALYGDGAANQGQIAEAFNIAALWQLPVVFVCENNHYGMGTAEWRGSKSSSFYTRGDYMPGLLIDGMDVLAVKNGEEKLFGFSHLFFYFFSFLVAFSLKEQKTLLRLLISAPTLDSAAAPAPPCRVTREKKGGEQKPFPFPTSNKKKLTFFSSFFLSTKKKKTSGVAFAKEHALKNGPIVLEMDTYRYHGHSMSDPGSTYRTRDEVAGIRQQRDPVEGVRRMLLEKAGAEPAELKKIEKAVKAEVDAAVEQAKKDPPPPPEWLSKNVWVDPLGATARGVEAGTQYKL